MQIFYFIPNADNTLDTAVQMHAFALMFIHIISSYKGFLIPASKDVKDVLSKQPLKKTYNLRMDAAQMYIMNLSSCIFVPYAYNSTV